jgi:hypothetical protein
MVRIKKGIIACLIFLMAIAGGTDIAAASFNETYPLLQTPYFQIGVMADNPGAVGIYIGNPAEAAKDTQQDFLFNETMAYALQNNRGGTLDKFIAYYGSNVSQFNATVAQALAAYREGKPEDILSGVNRKAEFKEKINNHLKTLSFFEYFGKVEATACGGNAPCIARIEVPAD